MTPGDEQRPLGAGSAIPMPRIDRRRVLIGAAWAAPAVLIATSAPAAAASQTGGRLTYIGLSGFWVPNFWDNSSGTNITVTVANANLQNVPTDSGSSVPSVTSFTLTFVLIVGAIANPRWGFGSNNEGVSDPVRWELVSGPSVSGGVATLVMRYMGPPINTWGNIQPTAWVETAGNQSNQSLSSTVVAIHADGLTSTDASVATVATFLMADMPVVDTDNDDWRIFPQP